MKKTILTLTAVTLAGATPAVAGDITTEVRLADVQGFKGLALNENRLSGGVSLSVSDANSLGVTYYRTTGTTRSDAIDLGLNHKF